MSAPNEQWKDGTPPEQQPEPQAESHSMIVRGCLDYPTDVPPETVILGNGWLRRGDIATLISTAGAGKSVAVIQSAYSWGLGLPYFGIRPPRPLRILLFSGEDDKVTLGQCREGFLEHSEAITGRQLTAADLAPLDSMLRTEFSREFVGPRFHGHLAGLLEAEPADLVLVNPMLSYIGGEIVACASEWLRGGLMPVLQVHDCAAIVASHTPKLAKDGWENTDDIYSAIGGGEMANIPRAILVLRPTAAEKLSVLKVGKRKTTGWKDDEGDFVAHYFVTQSNNPERPAWIPVGTGEAAAMIGERKAEAGASRRKVTPADVVEAVASGAMLRQALIEWLMQKRKCSDRLAADIILETERAGVVASFTEPKPGGGKATKWLCLPEHLAQWEK